MQAACDWNGWVDGDCSVPSLEQVAGKDGAGCDQGNVINVLKQVVET